MTLLGTQFAALLGGTVIMEQIFGIPGIGKLTLDAITYRDYPQIQANVMVFAVIYVMLNLVVDISYAWLDPRIQFSRAREA